MSKPGSATYPRVAAEPTLSVRASSWPDLVDILTRQLAQGGVFVETQNPPAMFTAVRVTILPPEGLSGLILGAEVVRVVAPSDTPKGKAKPGVGVQIKQLTAEQESALKELLRQAKRNAGQEDRDPSVTTGSGHTAVGSSTGTGDHPAQRAKNPQQIQKILAEQLEWFRAKDPLSALGMREPIDLRQARKVYFQLCRRYHPDLFTRYGSEAITTAATELFALIRNAYSAVEQQAAGTAKSSRTAGNRGK